MESPAPVLWSDTAHSSRAIPRFSALFRSGGRQWGTLETKLGLDGRWSVLGRLSTAAATLLAPRRTGEQGGQTLAPPSLLQRELGWEKVSDTRQSQRPASSRTGESGRSHSSQAARLHLCPAPRTAAWMLQKGCQQTPLNRILQNSWDF